MLICCILLLFYLNSFSLQAKLRRMVEEHSTDLTARIDSDFPNNSLAPITNPACLINEIKLAESASAAAASSACVDINIVRPTPATGDEVKINNCDVDIKSLDNKKNNFKSSRPTSIESRRNKSLSVELEEDISKKDVKKTRSNPVHSEEYTIETEKIENDTKEIEMTIADSASPLKDSRSSLETRSDSPKPGCSSQPDLGKNYMQI